MALGTLDARLDISDELAELVTVPAALPAVPLASPRVLAIIGDESPCSALGTEDTTFESDVWVAVNVSAWARALL